eukprot:CAMPEP_0179124704 /NCGR_PEP_ID=MMETSP0796-20121207/58942_1 /TAXON_ID=73915 /ORGANISM="Pyrodinium bahamense, Strain pbaha01" /LENGTH=63 /DNA_ID=CAMNT_0020823373 /DNA_START=300 /DNA_END=487 /DNA_ORIENTATION=+
MSEAPGPLSPARSAREACRRRRAYPCGPPPPVALIPFPLAGALAPGLVGPVAEVAGPGVAAQA